MRKVSIMSTVSVNLTSVVLDKMRNSGVSIEVAMRFHKFMRKNQELQKSRKAVRVVLQGIRNNYNATH